MSSFLEKQRKTSHGSSLWCYDEDDRKNFSICQKDNFKDKRDQIETGILKNDSFYNEPIITLQQSASCMGSYNSAVSELSNNSPVFSVQRSSTWVDCENNGESNTQNERDSNNNNLQEYSMSGVGNIEPFTPRVTKFKEADKTTNSQFNECFKSSGQLKDTLYNTDKFIDFNNNEVVSVTNTNDIEPPSHECFMQKQLISKEESKYKI